MHESFKYFLTDALTKHQGQIAAFFSAQGPTKEMLLRCSELKAASKLFLYHGRKRLTQSSKVTILPHGAMSYSPSSSSNSPSSSAVASWYCWYSDTRSFMLLSASVNSISSMPSPVYQWRKAFLRNMEVKYSATRLNISWIAVELPANATAIFRPFGGISQTELLMLLGIHSTK